MTDRIDSEVRIQVPGGKFVSLRAGKGAPAYGGAMGDLYLRADGSGQTYRKETAASNQTGWLDTSLGAGAFKRPVGAIADTFDRTLNNAQVAPTTAILYLAAIELRAGQVVSNLNLLTGTTAMATGTNNWMALFDANLVMLASTADQGLAALAASTPFAWPIATVAAGAASSYTVLTTGLYYVGLMIKAGTMPTIVGYTRLASALAPILVGSADAAQAAVNAFPFTAAALTATTHYYYLWVS